MENKTEGTGALNFDQSMQSAPISPTASIAQPTTQPNATAITNAAPNAAPNAVPNAVPVVPTIELPILTQKEAALAVISENLAGFGQQLQYDKIVMPSGGGLTFEVVDDSGGITPVQEICGVVIGRFPYKAWWEKGYDEKREGDDRRPDCFSADNLVGSGCPEKGIPVGQKCATCKYGRWGSDRRGTRGKDCKDKFRVYILREGEVFPIFVDLPPTSIKNFYAYVQRLTNRIKSYYGVVTSIKLEKDKNAEGTVFSRATFSRAADLTPTETAAIKQYIESIKDSISAISAETIAAEPGDTGDAGPDLNNMNFDRGGQGGEQAY